MCETPSRHISEGVNSQALRLSMQNDGISISDCDVIIQTATEILQYCLPPEEPGSTQGLIYGNIQSGKTAVIIAVMALGLDNGYKDFVVLTSNLNALYQQTLERIKSSMHSCQVFGKQDFDNIANVGINSHVPVIFVATKGPAPLPRLTNAIHQLGRQSTSSFLVIDDEADQASLDTNTNNDRPPSSINTEISNLRASLFSCSFLQTTATPQALLLQDSDNSFNPNFVVVTTPGSSYVGGNIFFNNDDFDNSEYIRLVEPIHLDQLRNRNQIPASLTNSLFMFLSGAAILRLQGNVKNYAYLLHTSFRQSDHTQATSLITHFVTSLKNELTSNASITEPTLNGFTDAYNDLSGTFDDVPSFQDVIDAVRQSILSTDVLEVNASTGREVNPNPSRLHTIYIGGTKIGRGVTIKNLLVTYYGRDALRPQIDTVLQHARMYGYRQNELPAIRIYLPPHLAQRFYDIHEHDDSVRKSCEIAGGPVPVLPLRSNLKPTRRNVLNQDTVYLPIYVGGSKYYPREPICESESLAVQTNQLDSLLTDYPNERQVYEVNIDKVLEILGFNYQLPDSNSGSWHDELIRMSLLQIRDSPNFSHNASIVIVNRESNVSRSEVTGFIGALLPGNLGSVPYDVRRAWPALYMTRLTGCLDNNWPGHPFWVPTVRFPNGNYVFAANVS